MEHVLVKLDQLIYIVIQNQSLLQGTSRRKYDSYFWRPEADVSEALVSPPEG